MSEESPPQSPRDIWSKSQDSVGAGVSVQKASSGVVGPQGQVMMRAPIRGGVRGGGAMGRSGEAGSSAPRVPHLPLFKSRGEGKRAVLVDRQQEDAFELAI